MVLGFNVSEIRCSDSILYGTEVGIEILPLGFSVIYWKSIIIDTTYHYFLAFSYNRLKVDNS